MEISFIQLIGCVALVVGSIGLISKNDMYLKVFLSVSGYLWAVHFMLLEAWGGTVGSFSAAVRYTVSIWPQPVWVRWVFILLPAVLAPWNVSQPIDVLPVVSSMVAGYAVFHFQRAALRWTFVGTSVLWLIHNVHYGSYGGVLNDILNLCAHFISIYRFRLEDKIKS